jgi:hypothetical protein
MGFNGCWLKGTVEDPISIFLISGLSGNERANLLKKCLQLLEEAGAIVCAICLDGAYVNGSMCASLGANLEYGPNFRLFFIIFDPCYMIKLVRNALGAKKYIYSGDGKIINWQHFEDLFILQDTEKLHAANKLTKKHILYEDNKMNVRLSVPTLSGSVASALHFAKEMDIEGFKDVDGTAKFPQNFNDIFDLLNCHSELKKKQSTNNSTEHLLVCLRNIFAIYDCLKEHELQYLLTYKLLQDHLETFFNAMRAKGGFNNNSNAQ